MNLATLNFATLDPAALKQLIDTMGQAVFVVEVLADGRFRFVAFNRCCEQRSGISHQGWAGCRPDQLMAGEQATRVTSHYRHCLSSASEVVYEEFLDLPAGSRWWRTTLAPIVDDSGRVVRLLGTAVDITESRTRERVLEQRYQSLFEHAPMALWEEDYSEVQASLDRLRSGGISDLPAYLRGHPDEVRALLSQVRIVDVNQATLKLYEASDKTTLLAGLEQILLDPMDSFIQELEALVTGRDTVEFQIQARTLRGEILEIEVTVLFRELSDDYRRVIVAVVDITARSRAERARDEQNQWFRTTFRSIADAVIATDQQGRVLLLNPPAEELIGWSQTEAQGREAQTIVSFSESLTGLPLPDPLLQALRQRSRVSLPELVLLSDRQGRSVSVRCAAAPIRDGQGQPLGAVMVVSRVDERPGLLPLLPVSSQDADRLPADRQLLETHLRAAIQAVVAGSPPCALLYLVLERFNLLTEVVGHAAGGELLQQLVDRLRQQIRHSDLLVTLDRHELGILLLQCPLDRARQVAADLRQTVVDTPLDWAGRSFNVGVTIAMLPIADAGIGVDELLRTAAGACASARERNAGGSIQVVEPDSPAIRRRQEELRHLTGLREAMSEGRLRLYGQPVVDRDGRVGYVELLIRLLDRDGRVVAPGAFIPAAERYGLIGELDRWVIHQALARYRQWFPGGDVAIGINLSGLSLDDEGLADFIEAELQRSGTPAGVVHFEITETAAIGHLSNALQLLQRLRDRGCRFYLDDFGSGLASFGYLKRLPVDGLKIDRSFIQDLQRDSPEHTFIHCFMLVAQRLSLHTVAEGLEDLRSLPLLWELGLELVQGYALGRPTALYWSTDPAPADDGV